MGSLAHTTTSPTSSSSAVCHSRPPLRSVYAVTEAVSLSRAGACTLTLFYDVSEEVHSGGVAMCGLTDVLNDLRAECLAGHARTPPRARQDFRHLATAKTAHCGCVPSQPNSLTAAQPNSQTIAKLYSHATSHPYNHMLAHSHTVTQPHINICPARDDDWCIDLAIHAGRTDDNINSIKLRFPRF